jgi:hypothetical protein
MTKEDLLKAFSLMDELNKAIDDFAKLGVDFVETPFFNTAGCLFDMVIASNYTEEGQDWINWWYFEKSMDPGLKAYDDNGNEICRTFDELYEHVKQFER